MRLRAAVIVKIARCGACELGATVRARVSEIATELRTSMFMKFMEYGPGTEDYAMMCDDALEGLDPVIVCVRAGVEMVLHLRCLDDLPGAIAQLKTMLGI